MTQSMTMNLQDEAMEERPDYGRSESAGEAALRKVEQYESASKLVRPARRGSINKLCWDDIELGRLLEMGSFSRVYEATLRKDAMYDPAPVYAVKCLRENVAMEEDQLVTCAVDLALEANILAKLMHPNIIRLHGSMSGCISEAFQDNGERGFFLVLDLLSDTLDKRLTRWRREKSAAAFPFRSKQNKLRVRERIEDVALGIADGLEYIHSRNIIYRDLKPHNIGFDEATGTVKIFDFGLAREADSLGNLRQMTGNAGTPRYMAPEVARQDKYGYPSDVYSFSIILWEIATLERPFDSIKTLPQFNEEVVRRHQRPSLKKIQSPELASLLEKSWDKDQENRPEFTEICESLRKHLADTEPKPSSKLLRHGSSLDSHGSSTPQPQSRHDFSMATQVTSSMGSSRRTEASDFAKDRKPAGLRSILPWCRKDANGDLEMANANRSYRERNWVQRRLLRQPTMRLDLSSKGYNRRFDLGRPGSYRSSGSIHSVDGDDTGSGVARRPSLGSKKSNDSADRPTRRSSRKSENSQIEAMAAALAAEAKSNRQILRELKRGKSKKK